MFPFTFSTFWTVIANSLKRMFIASRFLFMMSSRMSYCLPDLHNSSLSREYRIFFGSQLPSSLFKWPANLRLRWANISYMPEGLDFSRMNLFGICSHHLTFSILRKWCIIQTWSIWAPALYTVQVFAPYRRVEKNMARYTVHLVFMEKSLFSQTSFLSSPKA